MAVSVSDVVRITAVMSMLGQEFVNVHHFIVVANGTANDTLFMSTLQTIIAVAYAHVQNEQSDELVYERIEGQNLTADELLPTTNWSGNPNGDDALDPLPTQVSANVYWPTITPRVRCTSYIPGMGEAANGPDSKWDAAAIANLQLYGDEFVGNMTSGSVTIRKGAYNAPLARYTELIAAVVPVYSRTQRRRRVGVGQ